MDYKKAILELNSTLFEKKEKLTTEEVLEIKKIIHELNVASFEMQKNIMEFRRIADYNNLLDEGFDFDFLKECYKEDNQTISDAEEKLEIHKHFNRTMMFGYPANMQKDSGVISYLRFLESKMYLMNNCGDAYHPGNYRMSNGEAELRIIEEVKNNLKLNSDKYWGYINSGGTEGNFWGLREGGAQFPNSVIYCSKAAHYSVSKFLEMYGKAEVEVISEVDGAINKEELFEKISSYYNKDKKAAILLLTCGTTALGSVDDVEGIKNWLISNKIPHYIHLDAAMYGGIPNNQEKSPTKELFNKLNGLNIDSISISLHKYIGNHKVNGILLAQKQSVDNFIDYIGQKDISILGSRDIAPFSTLQRIVELYKRTAPNEYYRNVEYFEKLLKENNISYIKGHEFGNTFVIDEPSDEVCKKFQLATFKYNDKPSAHIIIFPYHTEKSMGELVEAIKTKK